MNPGCLTPWSVLTRTILHAFPESVPQLRNKGRQILDCPWNPMKYSSEYDVFPMVLQDQVDQEARNPSILAFIIFPLCTIHLPSRLIQFYLQDKNPSPKCPHQFSGKMCFHMQSATQRVTCTHTETMPRVPAAGGPSRA